MAHTPKITYNSVTNRWDVIGAGGKLIDTFSDENRGVQINKFCFIGSSAAIASIGLGAAVLGTITNATGLKVGDVVVGNPKPAIAVGGLTTYTHFMVPSNGLLNVEVICLGTGGGSLGATGWNLYAMRFQD